MGQGTSPFPQIESFIRSIISKGVDGTIRNWIYFSTSKVITYNILKYRYCENIGRHHKSNHIYFVVDLSRRIYYQKCYDPGKRYHPLLSYCKECRAVDYHSSEKVIPNEYFPDDVELKLLQDNYLLPDDMWEIVEDTNLNVDELEQF